MINRVDLYRADLLQDEAMVTSQAQFGTCEEVYLKITSDDGIAGFGEVRGNLEYVFGSTVESVVKIVKDHIIQSLLRQDQFKITALMKGIDKAIIGNQAAKALIDSTLHDLICRTLSVPLYDYLGGRTTSEDTVPTHIDIYVSNVEKSVGDAVKFVQDGFRSLKMRVGTSLVVDLQRLKAIRDAVGSDIEISMDANCAWSEKNAIKSIKAMERYELEYVEQPVRPWDILGLANVKRHVDTPIVADESAQSTEQIMNLISADAADLFHLKVAKLGGVLNTRRAISIIEASGKDYIMGQMNEGALATSAAIHCAASSYPRYHELEMPFRIPRDVTPGLEVKKGRVNIPTGPGLGLWPDEKLLTHLATVAV